MFLDNVMCQCPNHDRRNLLLGMGAAVGMSALPHLALADQNSTTVLGGTVSLDGNVTESVTRKTFTLKSGTGGGVIKNRDQIFYLDPETEASFSRSDTGMINNIIIATGGILSVLGPSKDRNIRINTPNAFGAIRGTTTYFGWQAAEERSYVCCCYGGVDLENNAGGSESLRTSYHNAVILPKSGGVAAAPYDRPLNHYDDDILALETLAGRKPRWQLPDDKVHFFAPVPAPVS